MDLSTFIVAVFCLIDDRLKDLLGRLRARGPAPHALGFGSAQHRGRR